MKFCTWMCALKCSIGSSRCNGSARPLQWSDVQSLIVSRVRELRSPLPEPVEAETASRAATIAGLIRPLLAADLAGLNAHRYARQISPGLQELVEAAVFRHYLATQTLLSVDETRVAIVAMLRQAEPQEQPADSARQDGDGQVMAGLDAAGMLLSEEDWLLGVFDAVGELMRWAITAMATGGAIPGSITPAADIAAGGSGGSGSAMDLDAGPASSGLATPAAGAVGRNMVTDLRELRARLETLNTRGAGIDRDAARKMDVMRACVDKVEAACYGLVVRGRERPKGWVPAAEEGPRAEAVEGY